MPGGAPAGPWWAAAPVVPAAAAAAAAPPPPPAVPELDWLVEDCAWWCWCDCPWLVWWCWWWEALGCDACWACCRCCSSVCCCCCCCCCCWPCAAGAAADATCGWLEFAAFCSGKWLCCWLGGRAMGAGGEAEWNGLPCDGDAPCPAKPGDRWASPPTCGLPWPGRAVLGPPWS